MENKTDIAFMNQAMALAQRGCGCVNPNPMVGAVVVRDGVVIATGYHARYRHLHAEREAFRYADERGVDCHGATMYVTLEPCCHHGHQPPCTQAIIEHGIGRVVVGMCDPNPLVAGKGVEILRNAGIEVEYLDDVITQQSLAKQNRVFLKYITTGMPWVTAKWAMTLDGKIATHTGSSKWITSDAAREYAHLMRHRHMAVMCGIGTVMADDPMLNVRLSPETMGRAMLNVDDINQPLRIVTDHHLRIPLNCQLVASARELPLVVATLPDVNDDKAVALQAKGVQVWRCNSLTELMQRAGNAKIDSVMVEGGGTLHEAMLSEGLVDEVAAFVAPKIVGGSRALSPVEGRGIELMTQAIALEHLNVTPVGEDVLISGIIKRK